jgi:hypothetical protein
MHVKRVSCVGRMSKALSEDTLRFRAVFSCCRMKSTHDLCSQGRRAREVPFKFPFQAPETRVQATEKKGMLTAMSAKLYSRSTTSNAQNTRQRKCFDPGFGACGPWGPRSHWRIFGRKILRDNPIRARLAALGKVVWLVGERFEPGYFNEQIIRVGCIRPAWDFVRCRAWTVGLEGGL